MKNVLVSDPQTPSQITNASSASAAGLPQCSQHVHLCAIVGTGVHRRTYVRLSVNCLPFLCGDVAHMHRRGIPLLWQQSTRLFCTGGREGNTQAGLWNKSQRHSHHQLCHSGDCAGNPAGIKWKRTQTGRIYKSQIAMFKKVTHFTQKLTRKC